MNKSIKYLLFTVLTVSASSLAAYTQHTYLNRRPVNVNLPMELTTFNERMQAKLGEHFGGNFQVSGFYGQTNKNIGKYFGINNKSSYTLAYSDASDSVSTVEDFDLGYIIHNIFSEDYDPDTTLVSLHPKSTEYGARFDYFQNMDKLLKGLYLKVNTTVVCVENKMHLNVSSDDTDTQANVLAFLQGKYSQTNTTDQSNAQAALAFGKIKGEHKEGGLADVDVILGYKFLEKEKYHAAINLAITIPTGNDPKGRNMFEPVYGNHSHFGFGGGVDAHANLWTKGKQDIKLNLVANYRYLFEASEYRPLKLKSKASPYVLLGTDGSEVLTPAVNVLTPYGVNVTPGSQFDGILAFAYNCGGFSADLGYNMYVRESEDVHFKGTLTAGTYGIAARDFDTTEAFDVTDPSDFDGGALAVLSNSDVDTKAAATPTQFTNGIYGGLGYHFKNWKYPFLMGIGGKYDWASKNSEFDSWSIWAKVSLTF